MAKKPVENNKAKTRGGRSKSESPSVIPGREPLENEKHEVFCQEILMLKPNLRAYQKAYPDCTYAAASASAGRLLEDARIKARLTYMREERKLRYSMTAADIHQRMVMAVSVDPADLVDSKGNSLPMQDLPPEVRLCIEGLEIDDIEVGQGQEKVHIGITKKIKFMSKSKMIELLGRQAGIFNDKLHVTGNLTLEQLVCGEPEETES
jgi:phage terminase small subunit